MPLIDATLRALGRIVRPDGVVAASADPEFKSYLDGLYRRQLRLLLTLSFWVIVVFWPLDPLVLPPEVVGDWTMMRVGLLLVLLATWIALRTVSERALYTVGFFLVSSFLAVLAWAVAPLGLLGLQYVYPMPLIAICVPGVLSNRAVMGSLAMLVPWTVILARNGWGFPSDSLGTFTSTVGAAFLGTYFGGLLTDILYTRFRSERQLENLTETLEDQVDAQSRELRVLARHLQTARDTERRWLSQELHDALGQDLTALRHASDLGALQLRRGLPDDAEVTLDDIGTLVDRTQRTIRRILNRMRPEAVEQLGLLEALRALVDDARHQGLAVELSVDEGTLGGLSSETEDTLYRVVQESLTNVLRHAHANAAVIRLTRERGELDLTVSDDGTGTPEHSTEGSKLGLVGIRERALASGGVTTWRHRPEGGFEVHMTLPVG